jgi:UDP-N-acetylglucosamine 1-carboxyvinyltransferase
MNTQNTKVGSLINRIRVERGLTQVEFAKRLGTSQSAVNRIEKGKQNLSMDMLARISDVLKSQIIQLNSDTMSLKIDGGHQLSGTIDTKSSKNGSMGLLAASLLNKGTTRLKHVPKIEEVFRIIEVLQSIGVSVRWIENDLEIKPPAEFNLDAIDHTSARRTRSVIMLIGSLMHSLKAFDLPYAGGCKLGQRTISPYFYALEEFGVNIETKDTHYEITVGNKKPKEIVLYEPGDTVTETVLMAAACTGSTTIIRKASANYMVQEVCFFLKKLGVKIEGIGTSTLTVTGIKGPAKKNITYAVSEDPIESMFFITAGIVTNSSITIRRCPIEFLELEMLKMNKMGVKFQVSERYKADNGQTDLVDIKTLKHDGLQALPDKIHALPYPGINMDNLPFFVPIAAMCHGRTLIHDWTYENRAIYYTELVKLGAQIELADMHRVYVNGPTVFKPAELICPPALRAGAMILIAMLAARGTSILRNIYTINRGYEDLAQRLNSLGAKIEVISDIG